jgi:hypothetical protein
LIWMTSELPLDIKFSSHRILINRLGPHSEFGCMNVDLLTRFAGVLVINGAQHVMTAMRNVSHTTHKSGANPTILKNSLQSIDVPACWDEKTPLRAPDPLPCLLLFSGDEIDCGIPSWSSR